MPRTKVENKINRMYGRNSVKFRLNLEELIGEVRFQSFKRRKTATVARKNAPMRIELSK
ncbi:MAG TPA: hypothetical protein HA321_01240 [Halobacteriales archaeon]|nr:hypothetical protein [Halobacteriales archaeon]